MSVEGEATRRRADPLMAAMGAAAGAAGSIAPKIRRIVRSLPPRSKPHPAPGFLRRIPYAGNCRYCSSDDRRGIGGVGAVAAAAAAASMVYERELAVAKKAASLAARLCKVAL